MHRFSQQLAILTAFALLAPVLVATAIAAHLALDHHGHPSSFLGPAQADHHGTGEHHHDLEIGGTHGHELTLPKRPPLSTRLLAPVSPPTVAFDQLPSDPARLRLVSDPSSSPPGFLFLSHCALLI